MPGAVQERRVSPPPTQMKAGYGLVALIVLSASGGLPALAGPALTGLAAERNGDSWQASCRLVGGITPEVEEEIGAGIETTVVYRLHVYRRRAAFFDQVVLKRRVDCTVRYDTLTQQYTLTRRLDGDLQETRVTDDAAVMREFMTALRGVPLIRAADLAPGEEYYLKAKSNLGLVWRFYLIPWPMDTSWERVPLGAQKGDGVATEP